MKFIVCVILLAEINKHSLNRIPKGYNEAIKMNQWEFHNAHGFFRLLFHKAHENQIVLLLG